MLRIKNYISLLVLLLPVVAIADPGDEDTLAVTAKSLVLETTIKGRLSPKSVVSSGDGLFFAQNMMYRHSIAVYNRNYDLVKTIPDKVRLTDYGFKDYGKNTYSGAPVEAAFSHDGKYCWVSQYQMYGDSTTNPGCDNCAISQKYDKSFVYKINTQSFEIENIVEVGSVPKYIATTPDSRLVLVSNWSSGDLSIIDAEQHKEIKRIKLGRYPRGIAVNMNSSAAYVAIMGSNRIAKIDLKTFTTEWITGVGKAPRHLCLDEQNRYLYASINSERRVIKIDLLTNTIVGEARTGGAPRSMVLSSNDTYAYVVCYGSKRVEKIRTADMEVLEKVVTNDKPIGITFDKETNCVWVACYSGSLMVFKDEDLPEKSLAMQPLSFGLTKYMHREGYPEYKWGCFDTNGYHNFSTSREIPDAPDIRIPITTIEKDPDETPVAPATLLEEERHPVKEKTTSEPVPDHIKNPTGKGNYYVIGGSYSKEENAKRYADKLKEKGFAALYFKRPAGNFVVAFGRYNSEAAADEARIAIRADENPKAWVLRQ